jgi:uncharacterized RDD family membrane protein YckC
MENPQPPEGPQSPGPQSPGPGPQPPGGYHPPPPPGYPQQPGYQQQPQQYGGPVPPGGWQQPVPQGGVPVGAQLASWGSRVGAYLLDVLIVGVPFSIVFFALLGGAAFGDDGGYVAAIVGLILTVIAYFVVSLLYAPLLMMRQGPRNGQTIGKQLLDIRAVRDSGQPWTFGSAALREVAVKGLAVWIASAIIPIIPWFLNYFWPLWDDENRALHDMAVSSHVVKA